MKTVCVYIISMSSELRIITATGCIARLLVVYESKRSAQMDYICCITTWRCAANRGNCLLRTRREVSKLKQVETFRSFDPDQSSRPIFKL